MKNYMYVYHASQHMPESDDHKASWMKWFETLGANIVDAGAQFDPAAQAQIKNGAVTMDADDVAGYTIVKAASLEEAVTWAKECPMATFEGCEVRVYETMPM